MYFKEKQLWRKLYNHFLGLTLLLRWMADSRWLSTLLVDTIVSFAIFVASIQQIRAAFYCNIPYRVMYRPNFCVYIKYNCIRTYDCPRCRLQSIPLLLELPVQSTRHSRGRWSRTEHRFFVRWTIDRRNTKMIPLLLTLPKYATYVRTRSNKQRGQRIGWLWTLLRSYDITIAEPCSELIDCWPPYNIDCSSSRSTLLTSCKMNVLLVFTRLTIAGLFEHIDIEPRSWSIHCILNPTLRFAMYLRVTLKEK